MSNKKTDRAAPGFEPSSLSRSESTITIQWSETNPRLPEGANASVSELIQHLLPYEELSYTALVTAGYGSDSGRTGERLPLESLFIAISIEPRDANAIFELQTCLTLIRQISLRQLQELEAQPTTSIPKIRVGAISIQIQPQAMISLQARERILSAGKQEATAQVPLSTKTSPSCV